MKALKRNSVSQIMDNEEFSCEYDDRIEYLYCDITPEETVKREIQILIKHL